MIKVIKRLRARRMIRLPPERYDLNRPLVGEWLGAAPEGLEKQMNGNSYVHNMMIMYVFFNATQNESIKNYTVKSSMSTVLSSKDSNVIDVIQFIAFHFAVSWGTKRSFTCVYKFFVSKHICLMSSSKSQHILRLASLPLWNTLEIICWHYHCLKVFWGGENIHKQS